MKKINLINKKFGKLLVLEQSFNNQHTKNKPIFWKCLCDCGKTKDIDGGHLRSGCTLSCGCSWYSHGNENISWKGYGEIPKSMFNRIKNNARQRNHEFSLTIKDLWELFLKQNKKCVLSGLPLDFTHGRNRKHKGTASLDRIDSSRGYVKDNIQWIHKDINWMKQDYSINYFLEMCNKIVNHRKKLAF